MGFYSFFNRYSPFFPWEIEVLPALKFPPEILTPRDWCCTRRFVHVISSYFVKKYILKVAMQVDWWFVAKISILFI